MACTKELIHKEFGEKPNISWEQACYLSSFSIPVPNLILVQAYLNNTAQMVVITYPQVGTMSTQSIQPLKCDWMQQQILHFLRDILTCPHAAGPLEILLKYKAAGFLLDLFPILWHANVLPKSLDHLPLLTN